MYSSSNLVEDHLENVNEEQSCAADTEEKETSEDNNVYDCDANDEDQKFNQTDCNELPYSAPSHSTPGPIAGQIDCDDVIRTSFLNRFISASDISFVAHSANTFRHVHPEGSFTITVPFEDVKQLFVSSGLPIVQTLSDTYHVFVPLNDDCSKYHFPRIKELDGFSIKTFVLPSGKFDSFVYALSNNGSLYKVSDYEPSDESSIESSDVVSKVPDIENIRQISVSKHTIACVTFDGNLIFLEEGEVFKLESLSNVKQVALAEYHGLIVLNDGTLFGWADDSDCGFLPESVDKVARESPIKIDLPPMDFVAVSKNFSMCLTFDQKLYIFGENDYFKAGIEADDDHVFVPTLLPFSNVKHVACCDKFAFIFIDDVILKCGGHYSKPKNTGFKEFLVLDGGFSPKLSQIIKTDWDRPSNLQLLTSATTGLDVIAADDFLEMLLFVTSESIAIAKGESYENELGNPDCNRDEFCQALNVDDTVAVFKGYECSFFKNSQGKVFVCGSTEQLGLQLTDEAKESLIIPVYYPELDGAKFVCGDSSHIYILFENGRVGIIPKGKKFFYIKARDFVQMTFNGDSVWVVKSDGSVFRFSPKMRRIVGLSKVVMLSVSDYHGLALLHSGNVVAWGNTSFLDYSSDDVSDVDLNFDGFSTPSCFTSEDERGFSTASSSFKLIPDLANIKALAAGNKYSLFVTTEGKLLVIGDNSEGQLGMGDQEEVESLTEVIGIEGVTGVRTFKYSSVLIANGEFYVTGMMGKYFFGEPCRVFKKVSNVEFSSCSSVLLEQLEEEETEELSIEATVDEPCVEVETEELSTEITVEEPCVEVGTEITVDEPCVEVGTEELSTEITVDEPCVEVGTEELSTEITVEEPCVEVGTEELSTEITVEEPCVEVETEELSTEITVEEPCIEVGTEITVDEPCVEVGTEELSTEITVEEPCVEVGTEITVDDPCVEVGTEELSTEITVDEPCVEVGTEITVEEPCVDVGTEEPSTEIAVEEPCVDIEPEELSTEITVEEPCVEVGTVITVDEPCVEVGTEEPSTEITVEEPCVEGATEITVDQPCVEAGTEEPSTEITVEEPCVDIETEEPSTEITVDEPCVEVGTEELSTEITVEEPCVEVGTEELSTEITVEEPCVEVGTEELSTEITVDEPCVEVGTEITVEEPCVEVGTEEPSTEIAVEEPCVDIETEELSTEITVEEPCVGVGTVITVDEPCVEVGTEITVEEPCVEVGTEEPSTEIAVEEPCVDIETEELSTETTVEEPCVEVGTVITVDEPCVEVGTEEPSTEITVEEPCVDIETEEPSTEITVEEPCVDIETEEPSTEITVEEPCVDIETEEPSTEITVDEPCVEAGTEEPSTEITVEEPCVEVGTEELSTEITVEEPCVEVGTEITVDEPCVEVGTEEPSTEITVDEPCVEVGTEEPSPEITVEEPCVEVGTEELSTEITFDEPCVEVGTEITVDEPCVEVGTEITVDEPCVEVGTEEPSTEITVDEPCVDIETEEPSTEVTVDEPCVEVEKEEQQENVKFEGYLTKQGNLFKTWRRRWFVLDQNTLSYFGKPQDSKPKNVIELTPETTAKPIPEDLFQSLRLRHPISCCLLFQSSIAGRQFYFVADTPEERDQWITMIERAVSKLM
ncbi:hypothetical protein GEMRC1_004788 [Eukaryota sp. GEM-RC1]